MLQLGETSGRGTQESSVAYAVQQPLLEHQSQLGALTQLDEASPPQQSLQGFVLEAVQVCALLLHLLWMACCTVIPLQTAILP